MYSLTDLLGNFDKTYYYPNYNYTFSNSVSFDNKNDIANMDKSIYTMKTKKGLDLIFVLPGFNKNDIKIEQKDQKLSIKAEKKNKYFGDMEHTYTYSIKNKTKNITSTMEDGILVISIENDIPKNQEQEVKIIEIK